MNHSDRERVSVNKENKILIVEHIQCFTAVAMLLLPSSVFASYDAGDRIWLQPALQTRYDSNVYNISDSADPLVALNSKYKEDYVVKPSLSGHAESSLSRQVFYIDTSAFEQQYKYHSSLNYSGFNLESGVRWVIGSDLDGKIAWVNQRDLSSFEDYRSAQKDMYTITGIKTKTQYTVNQKFVLFNEFNLLENKHSYLNYLDLTQTSVGFGAQYVSQKQNLIGYRLDTSDVNYKTDYQNLDAEIRHYRELTNQVFTQYQFTSKVKANANVGITKSSYDYLDETSKNTMGGISLGWSATEKLNFNVSYSVKNSAPITSLNTSNSTIYAFSTTWQYSSKIKNTFDVSKIYQEYVGINARQDESMSYSASLIWTPLRNWDNTISLMRKTRDSEVNNYNYQSNIILFNTQYKY